MSSFLKKRIGSNARRDEWYAMNSERSKEWYVYIVSCSDGTYYTGITTNIARRIKTIQQEKNVTTNLPRQHHCIFRLS